MAFPVTIFSSLIGTGEFGIGIPLADTGLSVGFSGNGNYAFQAIKDTPALPTTKFFMDGIPMPIIGAIEADVILINSKVTQLAIAKNFNYNLVKNVDIGISATLINLDITNGNAYGLNANPYIGVNINF